MLIVINLTQANAGTNTVDKVAATGPDEPAYVAQVAANVIAEGLLSANPGDTLLVLRPEDGTGWKIQVDSTPPRPPALTVAFRDHEPIVVGA